MCSSVLAMGAPMVIVASAMRRIADQIVVSVGPYMFHSAPPPDRSRVARSAGKGSPPASMVRLGDRVRPASSSMSHSVGVACIMVMSPRSSRSINAKPSRTSSEDAISTRAPVTSGRNSSSTAMSNMTVVTDRMLSLAPMPGARAMLVRKLTTARCGIVTPFGVPVEPEVKMI
ncbi:hypothetical protein GALL_484600 [mine drainage metagenome]|uniref:Uncharacterized protein n=1 Tax=mine drainage metagenome TaxID=410659 RepID=A0A1J5Q239_9ZZZZ